MKEVIVQSFCDLHDDDERVAATTEVTHNGRMLDVCEHHQRSIEQLMRRLDDLFMVGVEVESPSPPPARRRTGRPTGRPASVMKETEAWRTCPLCGHLPPTRSALGQHLKSKHGHVLGDFDWPES